MCTDGCTGCTVRKIVDTLEHVISHRRSLTVPYCRVLLFYEPTLMLVPKFLRATVPDFQPCLVGQVLRIRDLWDPECVGVYLALLHCLLEAPEMGFYLSPRMHEAVTDMRRKLGEVDQ